MLMNQWETMTLTVLTDQCLMDQPARMFLMVQPERR